MHNRQIPQKAQVDGLLDLVDVIFELVELLNAIIRLIFNFGQLLNGEQPFPTGGMGGNL